MCPVTASSDTMLLPHRKWGGEDDDDERHEGRAAKATKTLREKEAEALYPNSHGFPRGDRLAGPANSILVGCRVRGSL